MYQADFLGIGTDTMMLRDGNRFLFAWLDGGVREMTLGRAGDEVLVGDWDGDGTDTISVLRPPHLLVNNTLAGGGAQAALEYGAAD